MMIPIHVGIMFYYGNKEFINLLSNLVRTQLIWFVHVTNMTDMDFFLALLLPDDFDEETPMHACPTAICCD